jgi:transposase
VTRLGEIVVILDLHRQGAGVSAIARRTGLDRKTIRKVIAGGLEPPVYGPRRRRRLQAAADPVRRMTRVSDAPERIRWSRPPDR